MRKGWIAAGVLAAGVWAAFAQPARVALIEIEGTPRAGTSPAGLFASEAPASLRELTERIAEAGTNDLDGLVVRLKDTALDLSRAEELAAAVREARDSGVRVHVFSEAYGPTDIVLAAAADQALVQRGGTVSLPGLAAERFYFADAFEWMGVRADYVQVGAYKGAQEPYTRSGPSPEWDENIAGLLDAQYSNLIQPIRRGRGLSSRRLERAMEALFMAPAARAIDLGLLDAEVDLPDLFESFLAEEVYTEYEGVEYAGELDGDRGPPLRASNPLAVFSQLFEPPSRPTTGPTIAVLNIAGTIVDGDSGFGGLLGGATAGARTIRNAIEEILDDDNIRGLVVRIDSPGGSASASEIMWQGLRRASERLPVYVSVGSNAASGGYYVASAGQRLYVNPSSVVGSIGVVSGKLSFGEIADRLEINVVTRSRGPNAELLSQFSGWDDAQRRVITENAEATYDLFVSRVSEGRPGAEIDEIGGGRVFAGDDAIALGMADEIGGLRTAIADMAGELDLERYDVKDFPGPPGLEDLLGQSFGLPGLSAPESGAAFGAARALLGERRFRALRDQAEGWLLLRDRPVVLVSPSAVLIR